MHILGRYEQLSITAIRSRSSVKPIGPVTAGMRRLPANDERWRPHEAGLHLRNVDSPDHYGKLALKIREATC